MGLNWNRSPEANTFPMSTRIISEFKSLKTQGLIKIIIELFSVKKISRSCSVTRSPRI